MSENDYEVRAVVNLKYNAITDKDIISEIEDMTSHRKLGEYITNLIKFANENKEAMEQLGFNGYNALSTDKHAKDSINNQKQLEELKKQLDTLTQTVLEMRTAFSIGRMIGVEKQCDNVLLTEMYIQRQLSKLSALLGNKSTLNFVDTALRSRVDSMSDLVDNATELAIERYATELNCLSEMISKIGAVQISTVSASNTEVEKVAEIKAPIDFEKENMRVAHTSLNDTNNVENTKKDEQDNNNNSMTIGKFAEDADVAGIMGFLNM